MGYRSDVKIVFYLTSGTDDTPDPMPPFAALKFWFEETYPVAEARGEWCAEIDYGEDYVLVNYHDVKWYPSYEHVETVEAAFEKFSEAFRSNERNHRGQYEVVRVGENDDDIQRECSDFADYRLFVERNIIFE